MIKIGQEDIHVGCLFGSHGCDHARVLMAPRMVMILQWLPGVASWMRWPPKHRAQDMEHRAASSMGDTAFIEEDQPVKRGRIDFVKELRPPLSIGFGVSFGCIE
jgi:hypothetical protein